MLRRFASVLACLALLLAIAGCGSEAERNAMRGDLRRFRAVPVAQLDALKRDFQRYAIDQKLRAQELPIDVSHYLEWRRREWWNMTDAMAVAYAYEWERIEHLSDGVARYYGYQIRNFPRLPEDVCRFFERAPPEWNNLVRDVTAFVEWQDREYLPLRADVSEFLNRVPWEAANLQIDVAEFLSWRDREGRRMRREVDQFVFEESKQGRAMREDLRRFRAARAIEAKYLVADFSSCWRYDIQAMPPRLLDDTWRWLAVQPENLNRLRDEITQFGEGLSTDAVKLVADLDRFSQHQVELIPALVLDADRFFDTYEREWGPLQAGVRRWWTLNTSMGIVQRGEMRRFFLEHPAEEAAELQAGMHRFVTYGNKEWRDFQASLARFFWDDSGRAFGGALHAPQDSDMGKVFDDPRAYPVRGYDAGY